MLRMVISFARRNSLALCRHQPVQGPTTKIDGRYPDTTCTTPSSGLSVMTVSSCPTDDVVGTSAVTISQGGKTSRYVEVFYVKSGLL